MAYPLIFENVEKVTKLTLDGTVSVGDLLAYDGTGWVEADATDAATNLYAQFIALDPGVSGQVVNACKICTLYDADAPWTANTKQYLSGTAGDMTETRPTTAADVIQMVGRSTDTSHCCIDIKAPYEVEVFIPPSAFDTTDEPGLGVTDSPAWVGPAIDTDATAEDVHFQGRFPSGVLSVDLARVVWNSIGDTTGTISGAIICCADGATNTGDTGAAFTAAIPTGEADNKLCYSDITACFDADALKAGYNFTVMMEAGASQNGDQQAIGLYMRYTCV